LVLTAAGKGLCIPVFNKRKKIIKNLKINSLPLASIKDIEVNTVSNNDSMDLFSLFEKYLYITLFIFLVIYIYIYLNYYYGKIKFSLENLFNYSYAEIWYDKSILPIMTANYEEPECIYKCKCLKSICCPLSDFNKYIKIDVEEGKVLSEEEINILKLRNEYIEDVVKRINNYCKDRTTDCIEKPNDNKIKYCPKCKYRFI
jgi:hypothetical protein